MKGRAHQTFKFFFIVPLPLLCVCRLGWGGSRFRTGWSPATSSRGTAGNCRARWGISSHQGSLGLGILPGRHNCRPEGSGMSALLTPTTPNPLTHSSGLKVRVKSPLNGGLCLPAPLSLKHSTDGSHICSAVPICLICNILQGVLADVNRELLLKKINKPVLIFFFQLDNAHNFWKGCFVLSEKSDGSIFFKQFPSCTKSHVLLWTRDEEETC